MGRALLLMAVVSAQGCSDTCCLPSLGWAGHVCLWCWPMQAEVMGQAITWLVPHQLAQVLPNDVDYRVMLTFLELYATMLRFVHFRLYHSALSTWLDAHI